MFVVQVGLYLYGAYTVLYILCMHILYTRKRGGQRVHFVFTTILYIAATVAIGLKSAIYAQDSQTDLNSYTFNFMFNRLGDLTPEQTQVIGDISGDLRSYIVNNRYKKALIAITILANCLTDVLLIWRCYLVWGRRRIKIMVIPGLIAFGADAMGGPDTDDWGLAIFTFIALVGNLLLTMLIGKYIQYPDLYNDHLRGTAGRIFYVAYNVKKYLPVRTKVPTAYRTAISATLESGLIYPVAITIYAVSVLQAIDTSHDLFTLRLIADSVFGSLVTIMGIASTLIIVRVALGAAIQDEQSFKETIMRDAELPQARNHISLSGLDTQQPGMLSTEGNLESPGEIEAGLGAQKRT
ncbi:hypothetical protein PM082_024141 [Marasmius tenuissimus]|nr:hypothetical protein PM082_024141 [Marasmius tenuissimus]